MSMQGPQFEVGDHGTWRGMWPTPSRGLLETGGTFKFPDGQQVCSSGDNEVQLANSSEISWKQLSPQEQETFQKAAGKSWNAFVDNKAVQILSSQEAAKTEEKLTKAGELDQIMDSRHLLTDKNSAMRTSENWLPLEARARLILLGYKDWANLAGKLRKDAPTCTRHARFIFVQHRCLLQGLDVRGSRRTRSIPEGRSVHGP